MLRVVHFVPCLRSGGAERQAAAIIQNCNAYRHFLVTLYYSEDNYLSDSTEVRIIKKRKLIPRIIEFISIIRSVKPEIIYAWGTSPFLIAAIASLGRKTRVINGSIRHGVLKRSPEGFLRLMLLHVSKYVVANSLAGLRANKLKKGIVLYNGVDERFNQGKIRQAKRAGSQSEKLTLISVANLVPYKDYRTIFSALCTIKRDGLDFCYLVIGDGPLKRIYQEMVNSFGLEENVRFLGRIPNPEYYLLLSDIFIHSSRGEGCSNSILEAMYMGLPIVASDTGGTSEITGANTILFPYGNSQALSEAIETLACNIDLRKEMSEESYSIVSERFTMSRMISDYKRIISAVNDGKLEDVSDLTYTKNG